MTRIHIVVRILEKVGKISKMGQNGPKSSKKYTKLHDLGPIWVQNGQ